MDDFTSGEFSPCSRDFDRQDDKHDVIHPSKNLFDPRCNKLLEESRWDITRTVRANMELFGSFTIVQDIEALMMCPTFDDYVWCKDKGSFHYVTDCYFENLNTMERMLNRTWDRYYPPFWNVIFDTFKTRFAAQNINLSDADVALFIRFAPNHISFPWLSGPACKMRIPFVPTGDSDAADAKRRAEWKLDGGRKLFMIGKRDSKYCCLFVTGDPDKDDDILNPTSVENWSYLVY